MATAVAPPQLAQWLESIYQQKISLAPLPKDASFREYYQFHHQQQALLAVNSPPATENNRGFKENAAVLKSIGLTCPDILHANEEQGFFVISHLGNQLYQRLLTADNADLYYRRALDALLQFQLKTSKAPVAWSTLDRRPLGEELENFDHWFLKRYLGLTANDCWQQQWDVLLDAICQQPFVACHRDYHSRNLLAVGDQVGIIDFQDACWGPLSYDLVSLLRDCYIDWPNAQVIDWLAYYFERAQACHLLTEKQWPELLQWFDLTGIQRHLKAIFIFARKALRDDNPHYLGYIPRSLNYVIAVSQQYPALYALFETIMRHVLPAFERKT